MTQDEIIEMADKADVEADNVLNMKGEYHPNWHEVRDEIFAKLVAAKAIAELESQEPVAWAHYDTFKNLDSLTRARFKATLATKKTDACCIPLYTHPPQRTEQCLGFDVVIDPSMPANTMKFVEPPQRTWVGLTTEETLDMFDLNNVYGSKWIEFARTVEAKLKEKNT